MTALAWPKERRCDHLGRIKRIEDRCQDSDEGDDKRQYQARALSTSPYRNPWIEQGGDDVGHNMTATTRNEVAIRMPVSKG